MSKSCCIYNDSGMNAARFMDQIYQIALRIALVKINFSAQAFRFLANSIFNVRQGGFPVDVGLTLPK
jgi:hypothetical protein